MALVNPLPKWKGYEPALRGDRLLYPHGDGRFFMPQGVLAMAMGDGTVTLSSPLKITYKDGLESTFYGLTDLKARTDSTVLRGQPVGTALADKGLILEFHRKGIPVDPAAVLKGLPVLRDPRQRTIIAIAGFVGAGLFGFILWNRHQS